MMRVPPDDINIKNYEGGFSVSFFVEGKEYSTYFFDDCDVDIEEEMNSFRSIIEEIEEEERY